MRNDPNNGFDPLWSEQDIAPASKRKRGTSVSDAMKILEPQKLASHSRSMWAKPWFRWAGPSTAALLVVALGVGAYFVLRPAPKPDPEKDRIDTVFSYTLLTSDFNDLPIEERLEMIGQIYRRMRDLESGDAALMGAFAAGIAGQAREQLEENASRLMLDTADLFASEYRNVPRDEREAYLEEAYVRLEEITETLRGRVRDRTPDERLERARRRAQRDDQRLREQNMSQRRADRYYDFLNEGIGQHATPQQRGRISNLMLDMTRHLRGEDISTGERLPGGG